MIVSEYWPQVDWYFGPECFDDNCRSVKSKDNELNIAIFRQSIAPSQKLNKTLDWYTEYRPRIQSIMA